MLVISQSLLIRRHLLSVEDLVSAEEVRDLSAVGGCGDGQTLRVLGKEAVDPGVLLRAAEIKEVVHGAEEASVAVLGTAHFRNGGVIGLVVCVEENILGDLGDIGVESVEPLAEVGVLTTVHKTEEGALEVGVTSQERHMRGVFALGKTSLVILVTSLLINDRGEPGVVGGVELLRLEGVDVNLAETVKLSRASRAANLCGNDVECLVGRGIGRT